MDALTSPIVILHVDDYAPSRYPRTKALRDAGYTVIEADTGEAAIQKAREHTPALVILDVNLPDMSGFEVCRSIKQDPRTTHVLVLHVSATAIGIQSRLNGLENGADSYLTEPVDSDELLAHVAALLRLRTAEHRARQAHTTLAAIVNAAPLPMVAIARSGTVVMWNPAAERMFGLTEAEARRVAWPLTGDPRTEELRAKVASVQDAGGFTGFETVATGREGLTLHVSVSAAPLHGNGFDDGVLLMYEDISSRKQAEAERTRALVESEQANRAKDEFLAVLSHELRTPLNAVLGWIRMLRRGEVLPDRSSHALAVIERNAVAQVRLIEDILDVSRIISGKLQLVSVVVDLLQVVRRGIDALQPQTDAKHLTLVAELPPVPVYVEGDPTRLEQLLGNLLSNAVKFTSPGGTIRIALRYAEGEARIVVQDSGTGIDPSFLPYVFERFTQGNSSSTRQHGGLGLGLALVRHLAESHGGSVRAESRGLGWGSTFTVMLPTVDGVARPAEILSRAEETLRGTRVLIVDDHPDSREMVAELLRAYDAEPMSVEGASQALGALDTFKPDVIVADLGMPNEDGFALLRRVRQWFDATVAATPVIALSGYASADDRARAERAGFAAHAAKPVDGPELVRIIRQAIQG
jgi:PAS domain S-box-containing protein